MSKKKSFTLFALGYNCYWITNRMYWGVELKMDEARKPILEKLSELLTSSWSDAKNPAQIAREAIPLNLEEAYYVQDRMHQLLDANISG